MVDAIWLQERLSSEIARGNIIRKYADEITGEVIPSEKRDNVHEDSPSATSAKTTNSSKGHNQVHEKVARAFAQQKEFSGPLLPSEVIFLHIMFNFTLAVAFLFIRFHLGKNLFVTLSIYTATTESS